MLSRAAELEERDYHGIPEKIVARARGERGNLFLHRNLGYVSHVVYFKPPLTDVVTYLKKKDSPFCDRMGAH